MGKTPTLSSFLLSVTFILWAQAPSPASARLTLEPTLVVQETYTDNLLFTATNEEEDFGTFVSPGLTLNYLTQDIRLSGTYTGNLQLFVNNPDQNIFAQNSNFSIDLPGLTQRYRGLEIELIESFNFSPQLQAFSFAGDPGQQTLLTSPSSSGLAVGGTSAPSLPGATSGTDLGGIGGGFQPTLNNQGIFTNRSDAFQNLAGVRLRYAWTPRLTPTLGYENRLQFFTSDAFQDFITHQADLALNYALTRRTSLRLDYNFNDTTFLGAASFSQDGSGFAANDFASHTLSVGTTYQFTQTQAIQGSVGASLVEQQQGDSPLNFIANFRFEKVDQKGSFIVELGQFIGTGGGLVGQATLTRNLVATLDRQITRRFSGFLIAGLARNESLSTDEIDLFTYQAGVGLRMRLLSWLETTVSYLYTRQESSGIFGEEAQSNFTSVGFTVVGSPWKLMD